MIACLGRVGRMAQDFGAGDDALPFDMMVSMRRGDADDVRRADFISFDEIVIPVQIVVPMTPELRAALRRRR